jgi:hypothetical protein
LQPSSPSAVATAIGPSSSWHRSAGGPKRSSTTPRRQGVATASRPCLHAQIPSIRTCSSPWTRLREILSFQPDACRRTAYRFPAEFGHCRAGLLIRRESGCVGRRIDFILSFLHISQPGFTSKVKVLSHRYKYICGIRRLTWYTNVHY